MHCFGAHLVGHANNILQPPPEFATPNEARAEAENTDAAGCEQCEEGHARPRRPAEYGRCLRRGGDGKPVEHTGTSEEGVIPRREDGGEDDRVHKGSGDGYMVTLFSIGDSKYIWMVPTRACHLEHDSEWRSCGLLVGQSRIVPRNW